MGVVVITAPPSLVDVELAKKHLGIETADDDALVTAYLAAVCAHIDGPTGWLGAAIGQQTLEWRGPEFPACGKLLLPYRPAQSIVSVKYYDADEVLQTLSPAAYQLADNVLHLRAGYSWPVVGQEANPVQVQWVAGYEVVPPAIVPAVLMMVGDLYANRETMVIGATATPVQMSVAVEMLLSPYRVWSV